MKLHENIRKIREDRGLLQKQVAAEIDLGPSHYNKIENGQREVSVEVLCRLAKFYGLTVDQLIHLEEVPEEVRIEDEPLVEQVRRIKDLDEQEQRVIFDIIDVYLTKKRFKEFFQQQLAA